MNIVQRVAKNIFSLFFSGLIAQLFDTVAVVYLAQILKPDGFGKVNFAVAITTYFTLLANLGLPLLGVREIAKEKEKINYFINNIITLRLFLSAVSLCLLFLFLLFLNKPSDVKNLILIYGLGLIPSALLLDWAFQATEKMEYIGFGRILSVAVYTILILLFIKRPGQLFLIPCFQIVGSLTASVLLIFIFVNNFGRIEFKFDIVSWKSLLKEALPLGLSIIMIQVIYNIDTIMLGFMRSEAEIGYYSAAYKIILLLIMAGAVYFDAIFPVISNYYKTSLNSLKKLQLYTAKLIVSLALPLAAGGTILGGHIMNLFYGHRYDEGIIAFQILIWAAALIYLNMIYARGLWACDKQRVYLKIISMQAIVNILLNFILIPIYGIAGAAISTVLAELLGFFFYYWQFNRVVYVPIYDYILRPFLATISMTLFLKSGLNLNIYFLLIGGILIYGVSLYLIKGITINDVRLGSRK